MILGQIGYLERGKKIWKQGLYPGNFGTTCEELKYKPNYVGVFLNPLSKGNTRVLQDV